MQRWYLLSALCLLLLGVAAACETVPYTGRSQIMILPASQEMQMGVQAYQEVLKKATISQDPQANELVTRVGTRIARATGQADLPWEFKVIQDDKQVNAFALPGGKVAVYTGILPVTKDDAGLATVLGHEVGHVIAHHGGERVSQDLLVQVGLAGVQAALARSDPRMVQSVTGLLGAGASVGVILPFGRAQESEADHLGLILMAKAGYDPHSALAFWQRMEQAAQGRGSPPEFLATHPSHGTRVKQIQQWMPEAMQYYKPSS